MSPKKKQHPSVVPMVPTKKSPKKQQQQQTMVPSIHKKRPPISHNHHWALARERVCKRGAAAVARMKARQNDNLQSRSETTAGGAPHPKQRPPSATLVSSSLIDELTPQEEAIVGEAITDFGTADHQQILYSFGADVVTKKSMISLAPGERLVDEVIHGFFALLARRDLELCQQDPNKKPTHFFRSFFIGLLMNQWNKDPAIANTYNYRFVKSCSTKGKR